MINFELTKKEFRRLLDLVYVGNWVLNSTRGDDRFEDYDALQEKIFALCTENDMPRLWQSWCGHIFPSKEYEDGGIHEAIADYEDAVFFDILAEEMSRRDMRLEDEDPDDTEKLADRMDEYLAEFDEHGVDNISLDI